MHVHILGICGTFMGSLAVIAKQSGHKVTGCDTNVYPPMSGQLKQQGIELIEGYSPDQIKLHPDIFLIGNVVTRGNPLVEEILNVNAPFTSGPQWLADHVLNEKWVLAVAGTHGKTTTSSMLAWILEYAKLNPGFLIGGIPENFNLSARINDSPFFVIEADEYDTAFFDKRSKFIHYRPRTAILNNLEFDHADIFQNLAMIETQFHHFIRTIPSNGKIIANGIEPSIQRVLSQGCWSPLEKFGVSEGWNSRDIDHETFEVLLQNQSQGKIKWELLGKHNQYNALAALAAARHAGVPIAQGIGALEKFANVKRRMEVRGVVNNITIYDDFAHHPTAIQVTLNGLRDKVGNSRILAVIELRSNTMRMGSMKELIAPSLNQADLVFCYTHNLTWDAKAILSPLGERLILETDLASLVTSISRCSHKGDHVVVMSNGGFGGIHEKLLQSLALGQQ